jgi:hypothetical protein
LEKRGMPFEELVILNEIHGFLRYANWLKVDKAIVAFLSKKLLAPAPAASAASRRAR